MLAASLYNAWRAVLFKLYDFENHESLSRREVRLMTESTIMASLYVADKLLQTLSSRHLGAKRYSSSMRCGPLQAGNISWKLTRSTASNAI
jgi:hypothetical protein